MPDIRNVIDKESLDVFRDPHVRFAVGHMLTRDDLGKVIFACARMRMAYFDPGIFLAACEFRRDHRHSESDAKLRFAKAVVHLRSLDYQPDPEAVRRFGLYDWERHREFAEVYGGGKGKVQTRPKATWPQPHADAEHHPELKGLLRKFLNTYPGIKRFTK
jgi:hypothetical protein